MKNFTCFHELLIYKGRVSKKILLILLFCPLLTFSQWTSLGSPINGNAFFDLSGSSISLSTDGNVLAIGAPLNDGNGSDSGQVRVFQNVSGVWTQIGSDIYGETANDFSSGSNLVNDEAAAISLNQDGSILAIGSGNNDANGIDSGHVRIFQNLSGSWVQIGQDIAGNLAGERFGMSVDLNSNGNIIAIGGPSLSSGLVRVYELISGNWVQQGADIIGASSGDYFGGAISLNASGNILAVGAKENDTNGLGSGQVKVYSYTIAQDRNTQGTWAQLGNTIDSEAISDRNGSSLSLNAAGNIIAIGAKLNSQFGIATGHVRVFERISNVWTQIGSDIDGSAQEDQFGYSVSLSSNGTRFVAGALYNDSNGNSSGQVKVYDNISGVWTLVHSAISGVTAGDEFGTSVAISGDGSRFAAGAPWNSNSITIAGQVRVFKDSALSVDDYNLNTIISIYPNPTSNHFEIETTQTLDKVEVYSLQGQLVKSFASQNRYDISDLSSGMYFVKVEANGNSISKRIIKQ